MPIRAPLGVSDFPSLREQGLTYVDKTGFVSRLLADPAGVLLFPRPRRFGKTLNLSTLRAFVERTRDGADRSPLFEGLAVWQDAAARAHFMRYPTLSMSFKDVKQRDWEPCLAGLRSVIARVVADHRWLLDDPGIEPHERDKLLALLEERAPQAATEEALWTLSALLGRVTGERVFILIDEYDTPIHQAWLHGYYDEAVSFFRNLLGAALKDNPHLAKGVLTGILRLARESLFSVGVAGDLNNLVVHSVLRQRYAEDFGFTEAEVAALAREGGGSTTLPEMQRWYNGYHWGASTIYNPWSVLSYLAAPEDGLRPYWHNTGGTDLLSRLLLTGEPGLSRDLGAVMRGEPFERVIDEHIALHDLETRSEAVWSLLLFSGYLTPTHVRLQEGELHVGLAIPNREVALAWRGLFQRWLQERAPDPSALDATLGALLAGDNAVFQEGFQEIVIRALSFLDTEHRQPERIYHAFVLGLLVQLRATHTVVSNREAGLGRADVLVLPKTPGQPGAVIELKALRDGAEPADALKEALAQIRKKDYAASLREAGAQPAFAWAVVFDGKRLHTKVQRVGRKGSAKRS